MGTVYKPASDALFRAGQYEIGSTVGVTQKSTGPPLSTCSGDSLSILVLPFGGPSGMPTCGSVVTVTIL